MKSKIVVACLCALSFVACNGGKSRAEKTDGVEGTVLSPLTTDLLLLVGTYTSDGSSKGIYLYSFDAATGKSDSLSVAGTDNPSYLTLSPDEKFVYAVGENEESNSAAVAFALDKRWGTPLPECEPNGKSRPLLH